MANKQTPHEKTKGVWFCTVSHKSDCIENLKKNMSMFPVWAYIDHKPENSSDSDDSHFHTHFLFMTRGTRSIKQVSESLDIPANFIQKCKNPTSYRRYFLHMDNPEKIQYSVEDVQTNRISDFKLALSNSINDDVITLYADLDIFDRILNFFRIVHM